MSGGQDPATWDYEITTAANPPLSTIFSKPCDCERKTLKGCGSILNVSDGNHSPTDGALMQTTLQSAIQDCLEKSMGPCAATVDGVSVMGFPGVSDETLRNLIQVVEAWLGDAVNAGLLPSKEEALAIVEAAFKTYLAASMGPIMAKLMWLGIKSLVSSFYDQL